ncbi:hypothetical protein GTU79_12110 [Sodalis ligni]|uniref:hypothetical protein n=1 Tax=Sodalis ligni TaxID=2697027 RepID=UPI001BDDFFC6|nr:hypothetical protein [Sodalis ligni]QWA13290.1 hypothetical protein GTU79_12110 [Sodalis ligni]
MVLPPAGAPHGAVGPLSPNVTASLLKGDRVDGVEAGVVLPPAGAPHGMVGPLSPDVTASLLKGDRVDGVEAAWFYRPPERPMAR